MAEKMNWHKWKAAALKYARETYALDENAIDDDWHMPSYHFDLAPAESVDAFAEKYDLTKRENFTLADATRVLVDHNYGLENMLAGQRYAE
jgi:hypothetical protein